MFFLRPLPYELESIAYTQKSGYPLPVGVPADEAVVIKTWEPPYFTVLHRRKTHRLYISQLSPAYTVETETGWLPEDHPESLAAVLATLRRLPDPSDGPLLALQWRTCLRIALRHKKKVPADLLREARRRRIL